MLNKLYIIFLALAFIFVGCSEDPIESPVQPVAGAPGTLTIRFSNAKVTRSANSDKSEDLIDNIIIALYPDGTDEDIAPVEVKTFTDLNGDGKKDVTMFLTNDMVDQLFETPNKTNCRIFAVANIPSTSTVPEKPTIEQLKSIAISSSFMTVPEQESFVMTGLGAVRYTAPTGAGTGSLGTASGSCTLARSAAKISLNVKLPENITITNAEGNEETWQPVTETGNLIAYINNGVRTAVTYPVNPVDEPAWKPTGEDSAESYYNSDPTKANTYRTFISEGSVTETETILNPDGTETTEQVTYNRFGINVPFYSYPNAWSVNNYEDTSQTTLTLIVRWRKGTEAQWTNYYYQVPVTPTEIFQIDSNHSYTVNLKVGMLGSLVPDKPLEVEGTYQVMSWSTEDINVDINDYRYLVVNPNNISVQNEAEMTIPFYSSHEVDVNNVSMTFQRFNFYSNGNGDVVDITVPQSKLDNSVTNGEKMVSYEIVTDPLTNQKSFKINHPLEIWDAVNSSGQPVTFENKSGTGNESPTAVTNSIDHFVKPTNPDTPFSSYVFRIRIQHNDNPSFYEDIEITQYPGMYIEAKPNPGGSYNTSNDRNNYTSNYGFVFVNPTLTQGSRRSYWTNSSDLGGVFGLTGQNTNPNMYVIT
ncbi:MAG: hypothetical protein K2N25_06930, partial [Muribaculaceae bacterium]|nr:hypothetical protein [Muribaculaceae bacterium]